MIDEGAQQRDLENIKRTLRELPPSVAASFAPLVADLQQTIYDLLASQYWTQTETASHIASPGDIAPGNVTASGNVSAAGTTTSTGVIISPGSFAYQVQHGYVSAWINDDGTFGFSPSSVDTKTDLAEMSDPTPILGITPYWGRYKWDAPDSPLKAFVLAEDVAGAGFGPDVAPLDGDGKPFTVNYSQLVVPLLSAVRAQQKQINALTARLNAAGL
jgi:hypothetical protein